jgi:3-hydroxy-9,10-secoandrosta-1,3,5(10)-triene-9,17-dione monooxygenase reductase component
MVQTPAFDPRVFRDTLGHYASGITIISGIDEDGPTGFPCQSFYSVSTEPLPDSFRS